MQFPPKTHSMTLTDICKVMIRSWVWQESVDVGVCWRFFKYQLVLQDSYVRLHRDKEFLTKYTIATPDKTWKFPEGVQVERLIEKLDHLMEDMKSLEPSLTAITHMISFPCSKPLTIKLTP